MSRISVSALAMEGMQVGCMCIGRGCLLAWRVQRPFNCVRPRVNIFACIVKNIDKRFAPKQQKQNGPYSVG